MQPVRPPFAVALPSLAVLTGLCLLFLLSGTLADAQGPGTARQFQMVGVVGTALFGMLWLVFWWYGGMLRAALTQLKNGHTLGSWRTTTADGGQVVDVGETLAVLNGTFLPFAVHYQRVVNIELNVSDSCLVVHALENSGDGDYAFSRSLPFDGDTAEAAERCARALAERHAVELFRS